MVNKDGGGRSCQRSGTGLGHSCYQLGPKRKQSGAEQTESLMDLPAPEPAQYWTSMLPRTLPARPDIGDKGEWSVSRPLTVYEILERNRQLILTRMIQEDPTPEFLKDIQDNHPLWGAILMNLLGLLNIGGPFGNMDMLVTPVSVGGRPMFDDCRCRSTIRWIRASRTKPPYARKGPPLKKEAMHPARLQCSSQSM